MHAHTRMDARTIGHARVHPRLPTAVKPTTGPLAGQLQRKCACGGRCPACAGGPSPMPSSLRIGPPKDRYEQEADLVADKVIRKPEPAQPDAASGAGGLAPRVQRLDPECDGGLQRRTPMQEGPRFPTKREGGDLQEGAAAIEPYVNSLAGRGEPLAAAARAFMEPRLRKSNSSAVRVHTDAQASRSAEAINALAYTHGSHIVFRAGRYDPARREGRHLLAHELAHVAQQEGGARLVQRFVDCGSPEACPRRGSGEIERARTQPMLAEPVTGADQGLLVANFAVDSGAVKTDLLSNAIWANFWGQMVSNQNIRWQILGFSDCSGEADDNELLRSQRAIAVNDALPQLARNLVDSFAAAPIADCIASNTDEQGRSRNRSALIRQTSTEYSFPDETVTSTGTATEQRGAATSGVAQECADLRAALESSEEVIQNYRDFLAGKLSWQDLRSKIQVIGNAAQGVVGAGKTLPPVVQEAIEEVESFGLEEIEGMGELTLGIAGYLAGDEEFLNEQRARIEIERQKHYNFVLIRYMYDRACPGLPGSFSDFQKQIAPIGTKSIEQRSTIEDPQETRTALAWVTVGDEEILILATEIEGSGRLRYETWIDSGFKDLALRQAALTQGSNSFRSQVRGDRASHQCAG